MRQSSFPLFALIAASPRRAHRIRYLQHFFANAAVVAVAVVAAAAVVDGDVEDKNSRYWIAVVDERTTTVICARETVAVLESYCDDHGSPLVGKKEENLEKIGGGDIYIVNVSSTTSQNLLCAFICVSPCARVAGFARAPATVAADYSSVCEWVEAAVEH